MNDELKSAAEAAAAKAALPATVVMASVGGWGVAEWMYTATLIYVVMQMGYLAWKWRREYLASKAFKAAIEAPPQ